MNFILDTSKFTQAVEFVLTNSKKKLPDVLNRAALYTIIGGKGVAGAMQRTPKATKDKILAVPAQLIARVVMKKVALGQLSLPGMQLKKAEIKRLVRAEYARRIAACGYTAHVGWNNAAKAFGGRGIGSRARGLGEAALGFGIPATPGHLVADMANAAPAAYSIGQQALQDALNAQSEDMINHMKQTMQKIFDDSGHR